MTLSHSKRRTESASFVTVKRIVSDYWQFGGVLLALSGAVWGFASLPGRVSAVEQKQSKIEAYIEAIEEQKKLIQKAPPGYRWDETIQDYTVWKDDPRLKKK